MHAFSVVAGAVRLPMVASATAGNVLAYNPPLPVELGLGGGALALLGVFIRWLIRRTDLADSNARNDMLSRLAAVEAVCAAQAVQIDTLTTGMSKERHDKHQAMARAATYLGTLRVIKKMLAIVTPDVLAATLPALLEDIENVGTQEVPQP